jgi:hypothetical protein
MTARLASHHLIKRLRCALLRYKNAAESALVIGKLLTLLEPAFGKTSAATKPKTQIKQEQQQNLFL